MTIKDIFRQGLKSSLVAMFLAWPALGWSAVVSDRPLFVDSVVDHNLMFIVDDSGSMDFEVIAPKVGKKSAISNGYIFDPGYDDKYKAGKRLLDKDKYGHYPVSEKRNYYLHASVYNLQYYDPLASYEPWPSTSTRKFSDVDIENAPLDPGLSDTKYYDLLEENELGVGQGNIPATFFIVNDTAEVFERTEVVDACPNIWDGINSDGYCYVTEYVCDSYRRNGSCRRGHYETVLAPSPQKIEVIDTKILSCSSPDTNEYDDWRNEKKTYVFKDSKGVEIPERKMGFSPDGSCIQRLELVNDASGDNKAEVYAALNGTGSVDDFFAEQQQNFANWFSYYRRRHQAIRGAVAESVKNLEGMNYGIFWFHDQRDMSGLLYDADSPDGLDDMLSDNYSRFGSGSWKGGGTPTRTSLEHAGEQYSKESVRGNLECRKNFSLIFTDGYANNHPDSTNAGNADKDASAPFGDKGNKNTLADIAYYYYQGLRSGKSIISGGEVRIPAECNTGSETDIMDCNSEFHMNTYSISLGVEGKKYAGKTHFKVKDAHDSPPDWNSLDFSKTSTEQIDDLYHAAVNGKGEYYNAKSTTELVASLKKAIDDVKEQLGSGSSVSFNTTSLKTGGYIYSAQFTSQKWTGTVRAEAIDEDGLVTSEKWDAATVLDSRDLDADPRLILTNNGSGVVFDWANLTSDQKSDLKAGGSDTLGQARLSYIKGNGIASSEGVTFRERDSRLGAIINSAPVYVGEPNRIWPDQSIFGADPYSTFKSDMKSRTPVVYIGANDGMLHGFDADTGAEVLAYIPQFLYSTEASKGLSALTTPNLDYQSYVDLPLNTSDVYVNGKWRSIIIGGSRAATPGLFALDVTDPKKFTAANAGSTVLWEFSGNNNLGHMIGAAQIALLKWADGDYRWSAVFSNGYDAPSGKNGLFVLDIADPNNYKFIEVGSGQGLSPARLVDFTDGSSDTNSDGVADRAYAGDLEGRLWAIDLTGGASNWGVLYGGNPLFVAKDNLGNTQPITVQPDITRNTYEDSLNAPNLLVFFGTGKYLAASDIPGLGDMSQTQTFYGINDRGTYLDGSGNSLSRNNLSQRTLTTGTVTADGESQIVRKTDNATLDWTVKYGWYVDLPVDGERVVEDPIVRGDYVVFASSIPLGGDPCGGGGTSYLTALQFDGSTDPSKSVIDVNGDGELDSTDQGWAGMYYGDGMFTGLSFIGDILEAVDNNAKKTPIKTNFGSGSTGTRRVGWQELLD